MRYVEVTPPRRLAPFVQCLWLLEDASPGDTAEPVVPDGRPELVLHTGRPFRVRDASGALVRQAQALFAGQLTRPLELVPDGPLSMVGARFHPWAGSAFLGSPVVESRDRVVAADELLERDARRATEEALEQLAAAADDRARLSALALYLVERLADRRASPAVEAACTRIRESRGRVAIAEVARDAGSGLRLLERRFREEVGVTPKELARIERFQAALRLAGRGLGWSAVAAAAGYADQAHLTREFRRLAGQPPARFAGAPHELSDRLTGGPGEPPPATHSFKT